MDLLNFLAALALLLWGARQMQRGLRDLSPSWWDAPALRTRWPARAARAAALGGAVGSALAVLAFTIAPPWGFQLLLIAGAPAWSASRPQGVRAAGRALFGAGVVLLGFQILVVTTVATGEEALLAAIAEGLEQEPLLASVFGVLVALLLRSVFAAILLLIGAGASWLPETAALALLAGIHVGGALAGLPRGRSAVAQRRLAAGRLVAALLAAVAVHLLGPGASRLTGSFGSLELAVANVAFCGLAAALLLGLNGPLLHWVEQWLPQPAPPADAGALRHLESADPGQPSLALSAAVREVMRLADLVGGMLRHAVVAVLENDRAAIDAVVRAEQEADDLYRATKRYLARIPHARLAARERQRWEELMVYLIALEQIADGVDRMLPRSEAWNAQGKFDYPPAARGEFRALHDLLSRNLQLASGLCLERWPAAAAGLLDAEESFRKLERSASAAHIARVVAGDAASIAVSGLHLDLLADLAQMNARLCGFARFFLELREDEDAQSGKEAQGIALASPANLPGGLD